MAVVFKICKLFAESAKEKFKAYPQVKQKFDEFKALKTATPTAAYGSKDKSFSGEGNFTKAVAKLRHAHLTHDISIVYTISGSDPTVFKLFGIFSHDELGTGQPGNMKRQKSMASTFANQQFESRK